MRQDMQKWMEHFLHGGTPSVDEIDQSIHDFGFYHAMTDVKRMYAEYINKGLLGYAGGVLDQPDAYWHDIATMRLLSQWVERVKPIPRLEQRSVFDNIKNGRTLGKFKNGRH